MTSAGWQVTLCDRIWHVNSSSGEACCELLYLVTLLTLLYYLAAAACGLCMTTLATCHAAGRNGRCASNGGFLNGRAHRLGPFSMAGARRLWAFVHYSSSHNRALWLVMMMMMTLVCAGGLGTAAGGQETSQEEYSSTVHGSKVATHVVLGEYKALF